MVDGSGLENRRRGNPTGGSNPSLSAIIHLRQFQCYTVYARDGRECRHAGLNPVQVLFGANSPQSALSHCCQRSYSINIQRTSLSEPRLFCQRAIGRLLGTF